jgi:hypothetical protein
MNSKPAGSRQAIPLWTKPQLNRKAISIMATNPPKGDGHRNGQVRERSQTFNPRTEQFVKRDTNTGRFMDVKSDGTPWKGVRKEK